MMVRFCKYLVATLVMAIVGCANKNLEEPVPLIKNDPFFDSFIGKDIKMVIAFEDQSSLVSDTLWFDREGKLVLKSEIYSTKKYEYNSTGNLVRLLSIDDVPSNYFVDYKWEEHNVYQNWYPINHLKWEFETQDIDSVDRVVRFQFDAVGRLNEEINLNLGEVTKYKYQGAKMSSKQLYYENSDDPTIEWIYQYNDLGVLNKIQCFRDNTLLIEHFFNNDGLLDSSRMNNYTLKYSYIFY
jgi:hypothetical protein